MEYGKKDFRVGDVLKTKAGDLYILVRGDDDEWGVITTSCNGKTPGLCNYIDFDVDGNIIIRGRLRDNGKVVSIARSNCEPGVNRLSEALKYITGRDFKYTWNEVWSSHDELKERNTLEIVAAMKEKGVTFEDIFKAI